MLTTLGVTAAATSAIDRPPGRRTAAPSGAGNAGVGAGAVAGATEDGLATASESGCLQAMLPSTARRHSVRFRMADVAVNQRARGRQPPWRVAEAHAES